MQQHGITVQTVNKVNEGRPHIGDLIKNNDLAMVINTVGDKTSHEDSASIRTAAVFSNVPYFTTMQGAQAAVCGIEAMKKTAMTVKSLQEYHHGHA